MVWLTIVLVVIAVGMVAQVSRPAPVQPVRVEARPEQAARSRSRRR